MEHKATRPWYDLLRNNNTSMASRQEATISVPRISGTRDYIEQNRISETEAFKRIIEKMTPSI